MTDTQLTLDGKTAETEPDCTCGLKKPYNTKYHYPECLWLQHVNKKFLEEKQAGKKP
jgi:hypothetical protein